MNQTILCQAPGQMTTLKRTRTSILRSNELIEIQGSYWPRILILSESTERRNMSYMKNSGNVKKSPFSSSNKVSRRIKKKIELIRQLKKFSPVLFSSSVQRPISPSFDACPNSTSSISAFDQNSSPRRKSSIQELSKIKRSSFTGRPVFPQVDNTTKPIGQSSSGLKGPRRRKSSKGVVEPR